MTRDDVIRMAWDAGVWIPMGSEREKCVDTLQRFAGLVAAAEREACAKVCEESMGAHRAKVFNEELADRAAAIRARGNA